MKKNIKSKTLLTLLALTLNTSVVFAESKTIQTDMIEYDSTALIKSNPDIKTATEGNYNIVLKGKSESTEAWYLHFSTGEVVYCLEYGVNLDHNATLTNQNKSLAEYLGSETLSNKIQEYMYFGYGSNSNRKNTVYYLATQTLIWEAMNDAGKGNDALKDFAADKYQYRFSKGDTNNTTTLNSKINAAKQTILADIKKYSVIPSFCNSS